MGFRRALQIYVGAAVFLLFGASEVAAQAASREADVNPQKPLVVETVPLYLPPIPDLPVQPILPEVLDIRLVLRIGERKVYVYRGDSLNATYAVAVGKTGWETPIGTFKITAMVQNPGWTNPFTGEIISPGADSPLGERWIEFWTDGNNVIGFHGTPDRDSVGQAASHGCVRMLNEDIRELYKVVQLGTSVAVEP